MPIEVYRNSKVYVICPPSKDTGGTRMLQSICKDLRNLGISSFIHYFPKSSNLHPYFKIYGNPIAETIEDKKENILVIPEYGYLSVLKKYKNIRKVFYWLSWDFFFVNFIPFVVRGMLSVINRFTEKHLNFNIPFNEFSKDLFKSVNIPKVLSNIDLHLCQSWYIYRNLSEIQGINNIEYLGDYLSEEFFRENICEPQYRENIALYNPSKGFNFTSKIIHNAKGIKFIPLSGMPIDKLIKTYKKAKVYIDFGNHPGKDRIPREAAICGCCVITGKRGSAGVYEDVPIPEEFKFEDRKENIPKIIEKIKECFDNYEENIKKFENYRIKILNERKEYNETIRKIFVLKD